jgi:hypothetical protein
MRGPSVSRALGALTVLVLAGLPFASPAFAYLASSGSGSAFAKVGMLSAPAITSTASGAGTAAISWSLVASPSSGPVSYYVVRNGGAPGGDCPTAAQPSSTAASCTDTGLSQGAYSYAVVAVWRSWTASSSAATANLSSGVASQIALSQSLSNSRLTSGATDTLTATIEDAQGNPVTTGPDATDSITFAQTNTGTGAGSVTGLGSATASAGVATKTITGNQAGSVSLQASTTLNATATRSNTLTDTVVAGPASKLLFTTQPDGGAIIDAAFPTQPVVTAEDAAGNTVASYTKSVALSITSGTGTAGAKLSGCLATLSNGVTSFSGGQISAAGTNYQLTATDSTTPTVLTAQSAPFNVSSVSRKLCDRGNRAGPSALHDQRPPGDRIHLPHLRLLLRTKCELQRVVSSGHRGLARADVGDIRRS